MPDAMSQSIDSADCIVVGGGLVGMLSARLLAQEGLSVILLEQGDLCRESSWAGGGIISPLVPWEYPDAVTELVRWSQSRYQQLAADLLDETGINPQWTQSGLLLADYTPHAAIDAWREKFPCQLDVLDSVQVRDAEPSINSATGTSLLLPDVAQIRNPRLGRALGRSLPALGVRVYEQTQVTGIDIHAGSVRGVATASGDFTGERVVLAGGAWTSQLLEKHIPAAGVEPVLGQMIMFEASPGLLTHIIVHDGYYLIPRRDGLVLAGSTLEHTGFRKHITADAKNMLSGRALALVPKLADCPVVGHWSGLRPGSKNGIPLIGAAPGNNGLFINAGHFRNGVGMAPASARLLVDTMLGRDSFTRADAYRPALGGS
jgi:glycine oxidase